jgi:hypothetical protein
MTHGKGKKTKGKVKPVQKATASIAWTYAGMEVADGQAAGLAWESLIRGTVDVAQRVRIRQALLDYCSKDTLALVRLLEQLKGAFPSGMTPSRT